VCIARGVRRNPWLTLPFQVEGIIVNPGQTSVFANAYIIRAEHWIVVHGTQMSPAKQRV